MDWKKIAQGAAETGIGAITGGIGGAIGSGLSSVFGNLFGDGTPSQQDIMDWQEKMLQKQFDYNSREAQLNRDFQQSMMEKSQQWNSIGAQMQRAQAAGVNPFSLVNNSGYQSVGSSAMASGSQAAPASGMIPGQPSSLDAQRFNMVAAAIQSISNAQLSDANKDRINKTLSQELFNMIQEGRINEAKAELLSGLTPHKQKIVQQFLDKRDKEIDELAERINALKAKAAYDKSAANELDYMVESVLPEKLKVYKEQARSLQLNNDAFDEVLQATLAEKWSQVGLNEASAYMNTQIGNTQASVRELNAARTAALDLDNTIRKATSWSEIRSNLAEFRSNLRRVGLLNDQIETDIKSQEQEMKLKPIREARAWALGIAHAYANVISAVIGGGTSGPADFTDVTETYNANDGTRITERSRKYVKPR